MTDELQAALPREMYVDEQAWRAERDAVLFGEWYCRRPRSTTSAWTSPGGSSTVDVAGESVAGHQRRGRRAARGVQRLPAPRLPAVRTRRSRRGGVARCAAPTTPGPTVSTAGCCKAPHAEVARPGRRSRCTRSGVEVWQGFVFVHLTPARATPARRAGGARRRALANYGLGDLVTGQRRCATRSRPTTRCCSRTTTSATTAGRCTPSCRGWCRRSPAAAPGLDWENGIPHREGAWTFTTTGTTTRAPLPGLDEDERTRHKGDLVYPNLMLSRLGRPRRGVRAAPARRRPHRRHLLAALRPRRGRGPRPSTRATPPSSGTSSTGRTGRSASRCSAACRRAPTPTAGSRRWRTTASTSAAGCCPGWSGDVDERARRLRRRRARRAGQRRRLGAGPARAPGARARAVRARPQPRRQPRHQPDPAAQLPHAGVRPADPGGVRRLGPARAATPATAAGHPRRRARPLPARPGDPADRLHRSRWTRSASPTRRWTPARCQRRWPQLRAARRAPWRSSRPRGSIVPPAGPRRCCTSRPARLGAELRDHSPVARPRRPRRRAVTRHDPARRASSCRWRRGHRRRLDQRRGRPPRAARAARGDAGAGHLLRAGRPCGASPGIPLWIWMDDPSFYGFPHVRRGDGQGRPGLRRPARRPRRPHLRARPGDAERCSPSTCARCCPGVGDPVRSVRCQYTLTPDRDFVLAAGARPRAGRGRAGGGARLQVRADVRPAAGRPGHHGGDDDRRVGVPARPRRR